MPGSRGAVTCGVSDGSVGEEAGLQGVPPGARGALREEGQEHPLWRSARAGVRVSLGSCVGGALATASVI